MASEATRSRVLDALDHLLEPVVLVLLKCGVTWKEFSDLTKAKFVRVATEEFGIRGRPTNASRVAILTGIDRRDVRKLRQAIAHRRPLDPGYMSKPSQVLDGWFHDGEFRAPSGGARDLDLEGEQGSFTDLVRRYAPGIPPVAMLKQLKAAAAIEELRDGKLRAVKRAYVPRALNENHIRLWGSVLNDIGTTWEYNLTRAQEQPSWFERRAINLSVDPKDIEAFQSFLEKEGMAFLERVDDWLSAHESKSGEGTRLGAGLYYIQEPPTRRARQQRTSS
ncbi:MAG: DUF6502 family protein [Steroidobacterales bacterium]